MDKQVELLHHYVYMCVCVCVCVCVSMLSLVPKPGTVSSKAVGQVIEQKPRERSVSSSHLAT